MSRGKQGQKGPDRFFLSGPWGGYDLCRPGRRWDTQIPNSSAGRISTWLVTRKTDTWDKGWKGTNGRSRSRAIHTPAHSQKRASPRSARPPPRISPIKAYRRIKTGRSQRGAGTGAGRFLGDCPANKGRKRRQNELWLTAASCTSLFSMERNTAYNL